MKYFVSVEEAVANAMETGRANGQELKAVPCMERKALGKAYGADRKKRDVVRIVTGFFAGEETILAYITDAGPRRYELFTLE
jgi:hypothetical protein